MRFAHISDMHLGLALNGYSFLEDQKYIKLKGVTSYETIPMVDR